MAGVRGRFAPSPTGQLHLGNLRTALVAWLFARSSGGRFVVRMEDLDLVTAHPEHEAQQLADLAALGLDWDGEVVRQTDRFDRYDAAIERLTAEGRTYPCFCSRREIREAASAPHDGPVPDGAYPGTCRDLTAAEQRRRGHSEGFARQVPKRHFDTAGGSQELVRGTIGTRAGKIRGTNPEVRVDRIDLQRVLIDEPRLERPDLFADPNCGRAVSLADPV